MEISEPAVIARLPRLQIESGHNLFSPVYGLRNGVKRKRQEICAAVDGDSIGIYDVRNGRTISSYAIPPDLTLQCAPYAVQTHDDHSTSRYIYYVGKRRDGLTLSVLKQNVGESRATISSKTIMLSSTWDIVQLDVLSEPGLPKLLVVGKDASFEIYSGGDLSQVNKGTLNGAKDDDRLVFVNWLSSSQALKSILKARPDLLVTSQPRTSFIFGVFCNSTGDKQVESKVKIGLWELSASLEQNRNPIHLAPICYHELMICTGPVQWEQNPITMIRQDTWMTVKTQATIHIYDLTPTIPRKVGETSFSSTDQLSSVFVSESLLLSSTPTSLQVHNINFRTLQSNLNLNTNSLKRKRTSSPGGHIMFIAYFPKLSRAIAMRRSYLVVVDIQNTAGQPVTTAIKQNSLLVNNLGRGVSSYDRSKSSDQVAETSVGRVYNPQDQKSKWQKVTKQLEEMRQADDAAGFTKLFLEHVADAGIKTSRQTRTIPDWKANWIITRMFKISEASEGGPRDSDQKLRLSFLAHDVLMYLAERGSLTAGKVFRALGFGFEPSPAQHEYHHFIKALLESDNALGLMKSYLTRAAHVDRWEICASIHLFLQRALTGSHATLSSDDIDHQISITEVNATKFLNQQVLDEQQGAAVRMCLSIAIERLCDLAPGSLSIYMRKHFRQAESVALIQFLRQQLFRSGYTTSLQAQSYPSAPASEPGVALQDVSQSEPHQGITLGAIVSTLSDCIDAIGPTGLLSFGDEGEFVQSLIPELASEISRATEALQDVIALRGFLRETLRFAESSDANRLQATMTNGDVGKLRLKKTGTVLTLYSESTLDEVAANDTALLPLGLRAEGRINTHKVRKGDGSVHKRSDREMGMLQERLRGPYALERLII